jgi:fructuronate reductase/mannitol 2-dehydrogenase
LPFELSDRTLHRHALEVGVPRYDRRALRPGVVHLGVGCFHRSHQAVYLDDLAQLGHTGWGVTGAGVRSRGMLEALAPQDRLYTLVERRPAADRARVIGVLTRYLCAPDGARPVVAALADPRTQLVTLTITGAAYDVDATTGGLDARDLSAIGLVVEALAARRSARQPPFTVLSCDNMPASGEVTRRAVLATAHASDPALAGWIERHGAFPSSMVDRITPQTTDADRDRLAREFGVVDRCPVVTEPFSDWVVEDAFCGERPPLDEVGVRFVDDVRPYSLAKTRLLNASHVVLGLLGRAAGLTTVSEMMADPLHRAFVASLMDEICPALPCGALDLEAYTRSLLERLVNPRIEDQLERLCRDAPVKFARHVLPSVLSARSARRPAPCLTLAVAALCLQPRSRPARFTRIVAADPRTVLADTTVCGSLGEDERFVAELERVVRELEAGGVRATVRSALVPPALAAV